MKLHSSCTKRCFLIPLRYTGCRKGGNCMTEREQIRRRYSFLKNIRYACTHIHTAGNRYYIYMALDIIAQVTVPVIMLLLPAQIVELLQNRASLAASNSNDLAAGHPAFECGEILHTSETGNHGTAAV